MNFTPLAVQTTSQDVLAVPATGLLAYAWLLVAVPAASAALLLLLGRRSDKWGHWLALAAAGFDACFGLTLIWKLLSLPASQRVTDHHLWRWFSAGKWELDLGIRVDPLSLTFVGLVTFVGFLIHVYSVAYMSHDRDRRRVFA